MVNGIQNNTLYPLPQTNLTATSSLPSNEIADLQKIENDLIAFRQDGNSAHLEDIQNLSADLNKLITANPNPNPNIQNALRQTVTIGSNAVFFGIFDPNQLNNLNAIVTGLLQS